jgi:hypothetical protein
MSNVFKNETRTLVYFWWWWRYNKYKYYLSNKCIHMYPKHGCHLAYTNCSICVPCTNLCITRSIYLWSLDQLMTIFLSWSVSIKSNTFHLKTHLKRAENNSKSAKNIWNFSRKKIEIFFQKDSGIFYFKKKKPKTFFSRKTPNIFYLKSKLFPQKKTLKLFFKINFEFYFRKTHRNFSKINWFY